MSENSVCLGMGFNSHQWFVLILFSVLAVTTSSIITLQAAFFPLEAETWNATSAEAGVVFASFDIAVVIFAPILGSFACLLGLKNLLLIGTLIQAISLGLFGALQEVTGQPFFFTSAILLRLCEGMGFAATFIAMCSSVSSEFPNAVPIIYSMIVMWVSVGIAVGSLIGALLFETGGFLCPFLTIGVILLAVSFFIPFVFWNKTLVASRNTGNVLKVIKKPLIFLVHLVLCFSTMLLMFVYASLPSFLQDAFDMDASSIGWTFGIIVVVKAVTCITLGYLVRAFLAPAIVMGMAAIFSFAGCLFIGPLPFISSQPDFALTCVGLALLGIGTSALSLATFLVAFTEAINYGFAEHASTVSSVVGSFIGMQRLGGAIGPLISGWIFETSGVGNEGTAYVDFALSILVVRLKTKDATSIDTRPFLKAQYLASLACCVCVYLKSSKNFFN